MFINLTQSGSLTAAATSD